MKKIAKSSPDVVLVTQTRRRDDDADCWLIQGKTVTHSGTVYGWRYTAWDEAQLVAAIDRCLDKHLRWHRAPRAQEGLHL